jgi:hypothetical protein
MVPRKTGDTMTETGSVLPEASEWNAAVEHSKAHPTHILGPYEDAYGALHMCCDGSGGPYEQSNCDFTTEPPRDASGHDGRCCMDGVAPTAGPHPDCPGVEALNEAYATAKAENDFAADLPERE